jgi:hypothetical protein
MFLTPIYLLCTFSSLKVNTFFVSLFTDNFIMSKSPVLLLIALNSAVVLFQVFEIVFSEIRSLYFFISLCILVTSFGCYCYTLSSMGGILAAIKQQEISDAFSISFCLMILGLICLFSPFIFGFISTVISGIFWIFSIPWYIWRFYLGACQLC